MILFVLFSLATARLQDAIHSFPCNGVNPRDEFQVCRYKDFNETVFQTLRASEQENAIVGIGLNGTDRFAVAWLSTQGGSRVSVFDGQGKSVNEVILTDSKADYMPAIAPLSNRGFAVAIATEGGVVLTGTFDNNGNEIMPLTNVGFQKITSAPKIIGLSEDRFVILALDSISQLQASVWYRTERINVFEIVGAQDVKQFTGAALSGDSYVVLSATPDGVLRMNVYRVTSQEIYTLEDVEANGVITREINHVSITALEDNHFAVVVTAFPRILVYTYHFKDARELRGNNDQIVRVTSPQQVPGKTAAADAASPAHVSYRQGGFVVTYVSTAVQAVALVFKGDGVANATRVVLDNGPVDIDIPVRATAISYQGAKFGGFAAGLSTKDGKPGFESFEPAAFGELMGRDMNGKRQVTNATLSTSVAATTTVAVAPTTAAPTTITRALTSAANPKTTKDAAGTTAPKNGDPAKENVFSNGVYSPVVFTTSEFRTVALWLEPGSAGASEDGVRGMNAKFSVFEPNGALVVGNVDVVSDSSIVDLDNGPVVMGSSSASSIGLSALALIALFH